MTNPTIRTFDVCWESPSGPNGTTTVLDKTVHAAYFQQGLGVGEDGAAFIAFKDDAHKPVFTIRAASVLTIEEIRDEQQGAVGMPMTPEMQARMNAGSGYGMSTGYTTVHTTGGLTIPQQATSSDE